MIWIDGPVLSFPQRWSRTIDSLRQWSSRTLKYTRQLFQERLGHGARTQDIELEQNIQVYFELKMIENKDFIFSFFMKQNDVTNIY
jgi:hypothetical protein